MIMAWQAAVEIKWGWRRRVRWMAVKWRWVEWMRKWRRMARVKWRARGLAKWLGGPADPILSLFEIPIPEKI
jgi:hypothetical protein